MQVFTPDSSWTWYVLEGGALEDDYLFFGLVDGVATELGHFSLRELGQVRGPFGLAVERDLWWHPVPLSEVCGR